MGRWSMEVDGGQFDRRWAKRTDTVVDGCTLERSKLGRR